MDGNLDVGLKEKQNEDRGAQIVRDVFGIPLSEVDTVKTEVQRASNRVFIIVHPYFEGYGHDSHSKTDPHLARVVQRIDKFLASASTRKPPIIIFEPHVSLPSTEQRVRGLQSDSSVGSIYFMPTKKADPTPELTIELPNGDGPGKGLWSDVIDALRYLGVKKVLLGGMYLRTSGTIDPQYVRGCVNYTWRQLARHFDVEISSFVGPAQRRDVIQKKI